MRRLKVTVGDKHAVYRLTEDAPHTADQLWQSLPITGQITHARWAGSAVWVKTANPPISGLSECELPVTSIYPGTIVVKPNPRGVAEIFMSYGVAESRGPQGRTYATPVAEIEDDSTGIFTAFGDTWRGGSADVVIEGVED